MDAAKREALEMLAEMLKGRNREFWATGWFNVTVTDEAGRVLFALDLSGVKGPAPER